MRHLALVGLLFALFGCGDLENVDQDALATRAGDAAGNRLFTYLLQCEGDIVALALGGSATIQDLCPNFTVSDPDAPEDPAPVQ